jgi:hypothetical protein
MLPQKPRGIASATIRNMSLRKKSRHRRFCCARRLEQRKTFDRPANQR